jgi:hypothetical protein
MTHTEEKGIVPVTAPVNLLKVQSGTTALENIYQ